MQNCWKPYIPSAHLPWDLQRVQHLHRRAAFGATWSELQRDMADGPEPSVTRLLQAQARSEGNRDPEQSDRLPARHDFEEMAQIIGTAAAGSEDEDRLKAWWLFRILFTPDPLCEKLTLLWHNHFATSNLKVQDLRLMRQQNELLRRNALGPFSELLQGILRDPAMLLWLDADTNRQGDPNENLARELLELFTLGVGNYSETDVREVARSLTGWSIKHGEPRFRREHHDAGMKSILGQTCAFDVDTLVPLLLKNEATSRRLAWRLCDLFMGENVVSQDALHELAAGLRERELDTGWAVETILRSELFFANQNIGTRISSPVEFVVGAIRALELLEKKKPPSTMILAEWCRRLGQDLFRPPNVGGWPGGRSWLTSRTIVGRTNFAAALVSGELEVPAGAKILAELAVKLGPAFPERLQQLLLVRPDCRHVDAGQEHDIHMTVARLLSCPEAYLT